MFKSENIPKDVRQFLQSCITSALQVEVLLLLAQNKQVDWDATEVSSQLRSNPTFVALILDEFHTAGLLRATGVTPEETSGAVRYRYQPASGEIERMVDSLARLYRDRRHNLFAAIYSPSEPDALQAFSDAFRLNRDQPVEEGE